MRDSKQEQLTVITPEQVRAVHRASYMAEAIGYRGYDEEQAAEAYDLKQQWLNDETSTSMRQDRREALREQEWELTCIESHIQQAIKLDIVTLNISNNTSEHIHNLNALNYHCVYCGSAGIIPS